MAQCAQPFVQIDAFTSQPFRGNPAAVCLLSAPREEAWLQAVANEMNLSETAFLQRRADGFALRWFTPTVEVPLCGHATLASAHALFEAGAVAPQDTVRFHTASGVLLARRRSEWISLDFPAHALTPGPEPVEVQAALGVPAAFCGSSPVCDVFEVASESAVRELAPDLAHIARASTRAVAVTSRAASREYDFVSRFFALAQGIAEDPVTGSAHCCLGPLWAARLGKDEVVGYQASARGGVVRVQVAGAGIAPGRVVLLGQAVTVLRGELLCSAPAGHAIESGG